FFSSRRRHTRCYRDWSSDVCSSDLDFPQRVSGALSYKAWRPFLPSFWQDVTDLAKRTKRVVERFAVARRRWEERWGCRNFELPRSEERRVGEEWRAGGRT